MIVLGQNRAKLGKTERVLENKMRECKPANPHKHWRRRWDSNPRAREGKRISSAPRYDLSLIHI